jgi:hypothetical protein
MQNNSFRLRVKLFPIENVLRKTVPGVRFSLCLCYPSFLSRTRKSLHLSQRWKKICMRWGCELQVATTGRSVAPHVRCISPSRAAEARFNLAQLYFWESYLWRKNLTEPNPHHDMIFWVICIMSPYILQYYILHQFPKMPTDKTLLDVMFSLIT